jgi:predicted transposase YbfD/YdcC
VKAASRMHWRLDVEFKDNLSRYRRAHGAKNMAVIRRFALDLTRNHKSRAVSTHAEDAQDGASIFC